MRQGRRGAPLTIGALLAIAVLVPIAALAQGKASPAINIAVQGQPITLQDIAAFENGMYSHDALPIDIVYKNPDQMPRDAPFACYQGRSGSPPKEVIWVAMAAHSSGQSEPMQSEPVQNEATEAYVAAVAFALMDAGRAGTVLQGLYAKTPSNRVARLGLAVSVARAFAAASEQSAEGAASQARWIKTNLAIGTTRQKAYALLRSQGLVAYNMAYVKVKAGRLETPSPGNSFVPCDDNSGRASADWPYRNEPLPKVEEGPCADLQRDLSGTFTAEPAAHVLLYGAFSVIPICGCHTDVSITFDEDDRVSSVKIDRPRCPCV